LNNQNEIETDSSNPSTLNKLSGPDCFRTILANSDPELERSRRLHALPTMQAVLFDLYERLITHFDQMGLPLPSRSLSCWVDE